MATAATADTRERKPYRTQAKTELPPNARHCARCSILIFDSPDDVPDYLSPGMHQAHGEYCSECAEFYQE